MQYEKVRAEIIVVVVVVYIYMVASWLFWSDTFSKQSLLAEMVDHPEEKDDSDGDEEELKDRMHSSSFTSNLSEELLLIFTVSEC